MEKFVPSPENSPEPQSGSSSEHANSHETEAPFEFQILKGHFEPDGKTWKSDQELRMQYLQLTDRLIQRMTEGVKKIDPKTGETKILIPTVAVFLDKSCRPVSHAVREDWPICAKDPETGAIPPMPAFKFLNIDREQWINKFDQYGNGMMDIDEIDPSIIRGLRSIFLTPEGKEQVIANGLTEAVDAMPTILDGESVLIVDETYSTGRTLKIATELLQRAIPAAQIEATHWMRTSFTLDNGNVRNGVPVWYQDNTLLGRGVGNRYADSTRNQNLNELSRQDYYRTIGRWFLSSPLQQGPDELYLQLIREFKELAANPDVPFIPSITRSDRDMDNRIIAYNYRDVDPSTLSEEEREELIAEVIRRRNAITEASAEEGARLYARAHPRKRRR